MRNAVLLSILCGGLLAAAIKQPQFAARRDYPVAHGLVYVGDVNGDGIPDIVAVGVHEINTLVGNGDGTFRAARTSPMRWDYMLGAALVDLNGDGNADLIVSGQLSTITGFGICFSNGDGTFQPPVFYEMYETLGGLAVADFNGDGKPDVMLGGNTGVWLFTGQGGSVFNQGVLISISGGATYYPVTSDFNGDGYPDVAVTQVSPKGPAGIVVLLSKGNGTFQAPAFYSGSSPAYITAGDVNGDGYPDIVVPGVTIYLNDGHGGFALNTQASLPGSQVAIGDVNGDGIPDLVSSMGDVALGLGQATFAPPVSYPVENSYGWYGVALADLRHRGRLDIVTGSNGTVSVLLNAGRGRFIDGEWTPLSGSANCGAAADFNGDGKPDLAVTTVTGITVLFGTGDATAPYATGSSTALSGASCPITGDLNGDGIPDLLVYAGSMRGVAAYGNAR
jgi:FG-GAP-like repeat/FG-GAP repeat